MKVALRRAGVNEANELLCSTAFHAGWVMYFQNTETFTGIVPPSHIALCSTEHLLGYTLGNDALKYSG